MNIDIDERNQSKNRQIKSYPKTCVNMSFYNGLNITQLAIETVDRRVIENGLELDGNLTLVNKVVSEVVQELETHREMSETEYEQFLADVWVGVVLTLMVLSCVCCMCSCLLYHKFQQWKRRVLEQRGSSSSSSSSSSSRDGDNRGADTESLPSYTLVSGLPSYEEALEQLKQVQALHRGIIDHVVIFDSAIVGGNNKQQLELGNASVSAIESTTSNIQGDVLTSANIIIGNNCSSLNSNNSYVTITQTNNCNNQMSRLSVADLLQIYKIQQQQQQQQSLSQNQQINNNITRSHLNHGIMKI